jgi:hypothetical protein
MHSGLPDSECPQTGCATPSLRILQILQANAATRGISAPRWVFSQSRQVDSLGLLASAILVCADRSGTHGIGPALFALSFLLSKESIVSIAFLRNEKTPALQQFPAK